MHEPLLAQAAAPAPARVCNVLLLDYSLGHELFLYRERSPFTFAGEILPFDLLTAIWICSSTWEENRNAHQSLLQLPKLWLLRRQVEKSFNETEVQLFREYREDGSIELPLSDITRPRADSPPRPPGAPFLLRLHHFLVTQYRISIPAAWDFPLGEAKIRWATHWEQEGGLSVKNFADAEFERFVEEQEAKEKESPCRH